MDVTGKHSIEISGELKEAVDAYKAGLKELESRRLILKAITADLTKAERSKETLLETLRAKDLECKKANSLEDMKRLQRDIQSLRNDLEWTDAVITNLSSRVSAARGHDGGVLEATYDNHHLAMSLFVAIKRQLVAKLQSDKDFVALLSVLYVVANEAEMKVAQRSDKDRFLDVLLSSSGEGVLDTAHDFHIVKSTMLSNLGFAPQGAK